MSQPELPALSNGGDEAPLGDEAEVLGQVDHGPELLQGGGDGVHLVGIAGPGQGAPVGGLGLLLGGGLDEPLDRVAAQLGGRVAGHAGQQAPRRAGVGLHEPLVGQPPGDAGVGRVAHELLQVGLWQRAGREGAGGDGPRRRAAASWPRVAARPSSPRGWATRPRGRSRPASSRRGRPARCPCPRGRRRRRPWPVPGANRRRAASPAPSLRPAPARQRPSIGSWEHLLGRRAGPGAIVGAPQRRDKASGRRRVGAPSQRGGQVAAHERPQGHPVARQARAEQHPQRPET